MIEKFVDGDIVEMNDDDKAPIPGGDEVENPTLSASPEQKYVGPWVPGINQPAQPADTTGPYAGITRYLPIPESQIER